MFGPYVYPILLYALCVIVSAPRPELFESGPPLVFTSYVIISHVISHARHPRGILTRQPHLNVLSYALSRAVLVFLQLNPRLLKPNR